VIHDSIMLSIIVAVDDKRGIGKKDNAANKGMLWHISEDFKRFKALTTGHPIIMGRKTFEMIGRVLPNRTNIIVTRDTNYTFEGAIVVDSLEKAIEIGKKTEESRIILRPRAQDRGENQESSKENKDHDSYFMIHNSDEEEIFIIGGGQIFKEAMEKGVVDKLYLTLVKGDYGADTFFPEYADFTKEISREEKKDEQYEYTFLTLER
jgi:dihydrofolate reductase